VGRIGRELKPHRLKALHGVGKVAYRHAHVIEIIDIGQDGRRLGL
jgi:hypothetical protein